METLNWEWCISSVIVCASKVRHEDLSSHSPLLVGTFNIYIYIPIHTTSILYIQKHGEFEIGGLVSKGSVIASRLSGQRAHQAGRRRSVSQVRPLCVTTVDMTGCLQLI